MSAWRYKVDNVEHGPVSFHELGALVCAGTLAESALVRREGAMRWEPAWHVPGLTRAAETGETPAVEPSPPGNAPAFSQKETADSPPRCVGASGQVRRRRPIGLLLAVGVGLLAVALCHQRATRATAAFPLRPQAVDGWSRNNYFPLYGRCTALECGLLYLDVFALAAALGWFAMGRRWR